MKRSRRVLGLGATTVLVGALFACDPGTTADAGDDADDAGGQLGACDVGPAPDDYQYPDGPYGGEIGDTFANFVLEDCDGEEVRFADVLASAELVLFNVGAGWCQPCIDETRELEQTIVQPFCGRGLKTVQVLFQDQDARPATKFFCSSWKEQYALTIPVLVDPLFETSAYFDAVQTPLNMLIAPDGTILYKEVGIAPEDLPAEIEQHLPSE